jgi:acyl-CoA synthetase (AMP-forming)/AMP-acid ligase II
LFVVAGTLDAGIAGDPDGDNLSVESLRRHCLRELPRPKVPAHVEILSELPLNSSLKTDLAELARRAEAADD